MIVLPSIDEQKKCPCAVKGMHEGKLCWNSQKVALEENFAIRKHHGILMETKFVYLFYAVSLTMTVPADYYVFF